MVVAEETRKGPWTEEEDRQLVCFVRLFGERRWDFIAKVSGLHRTGKSCRLRWVNYLDPGLKRGRMSPQEERLILELHARWGNRWSRIARKLPGRTDNEIKNYWRTHMRKKAQERRRGSASEVPTPSSSCSSSLDDSGGRAGPAAPALRPAGTPDSAWEPRAENDDDGAYPMERIWEAIASAEVRNGGGCAASPPLWDYFVEPPAWKVESGEDWSSQLWCEDSKLCYP